jgi:hypothetical protein
MLLADIDYIINYLLRIVQILDKIDYLTKDFSV